ncbi:MAG TPA: electron transfer flavoprotein subunit alpha/FixB family protein [Anaeromyxobacteraceae bacterium]|nr:electron transfer flavoprotein subunit alpha/FixB family protein [Anaeromyxobacteraceae bacterium]
MKTLLVCEVREGKLRESWGELLAFAGALGGERELLLIGDEGLAPAVTGRLWVAPPSPRGEFDPAWHQAAVLEAARRAEADRIAFVHSSWGWDVAPRVAAGLGAAQVSDVVAIAEGGFETGCCNGKMRRIVAPRTERVVVTIQPGAFPARGGAEGTPAIERIAPAYRPDGVTFTGYEAAAPRGVDLARAPVIVSAGRGVGKKENVEIVAALAKALGGELGASRPVVDAGWVDHGRQVGTTGQTVAPKLYVACGISGAIQHLAGMKRAEFVVAINKDKDAPIGEVANVLAVGDLVQLLPAITARLRR